MCVWIWRLNKTLNPNPNLLKACHEKAGKREYALVIMFCHSNFLKHLIFTGFFSPRFSQRLIYTQSVQITFSILFSNPLLAFCSFEALLSLLAFYISTWSKSHKIKRCVHGKFNCITVNFDRTKNGINEANWIFN